MKTIFQSIRPRITAKAAEAYIPALEELIGNYELNEYLRTRLRHTKPEDDANLLLVGAPGFGKSVSLKSYLRQRLNDPTLGYDDDAGLFAAAAGKKYDFFLIDGASITEKRLEVAVSDAMHSLSSHTFVLLEEAGELYIRGLEEKLRGMMDHPHVTTYATAQNFHQKQRRSDTEQEHGHRIKAFLRRFPTRLHTEAPDEEEMTTFLNKRLELWGMSYEDEQTINVLVQKSKSEDGYNPAYALGCVIKAISLLKDTLTTRFVVACTPDPQWT